MNTDILPPTPVSGVQQPPADPVPAQQVIAQQQSEQHEKHGTAPVTTAPKPKSGVTGAIVATVIIVLGLGLLATYAYIQTK